MKPLVPSAEPVSSIPGYFTYQAPESGPSIHLSLAALDGILAEVMTGFGAIPKRGAEVGGILVGKASATEIWIESFAMAECEHRRGPSFLLSEQDREAFAKTFESQRSQENYPVGIFRSNTRDENAVTEEDRTLFGKYFEPPSGTFLLIRPYASKTSTASFLVYRDGVLPDSNESTFPFQRWELEGGAAPVRRPLHEARSQAGEAGRPFMAARSVPAADETAAAAAGGAVEQERRQLETSTTQAGSEYFYTGTIESGQRRRGWAWIPLSFIFLLLGVLLGFQSALSFYPRTASLEGSSFALGLSAVAKDDNLHIRWNRESAAIKSAQRGQLDIEDGKYRKTVDLDASSLQTGSVVYPPVSNRVGLRFQVMVKGTTSVVETLDWARKEPAAVGAETGGKQ